ncbi:MAG: signal recognition particle subunit SRP19/SEC65 family protein [Candidatus Methanoplasma sp.]|jgi:signal recognition particle subunit SRP19|nr:signal recognition particle subunit SRP19/SEC65 family protein [Candidatus Methanoplasma sp.]
MAYDEDTAITIWPEYFDIERTRAAGRRLPKNLCVKDPDIDIIAKGALMLDLEYEVQENKAYPSNWAAKQGYVKIEKGKIPKTKLLPKIAEILIKNQKK